MRLLRQERMCLELVIVWNGAKDGPNGGLLTTDYDPAREPTEDDLASIRNDWELARPRAATRERWLQNCRCAECGCEKDVDDLEFRRCADCRRKQKADLMRKKCHPKRWAGKA